MASWAPEAEPTLRVPGAGPHVPGAAGPHREAAAQGGGGRGDESLICGRGWPRAPDGEAGSARTGPAHREGLTVTTWTQEHTGLDACVQRRAGVLARGFLELVAFQGSPSSYPHVQSTQRRRLKRMGCLGPGEPSRGPWKSASSPPCDLAGHGNPTHLRNPARSPQRGHLNGTTPWAVGGAPPLRPGPGHGRGPRLPWPEEEQACGGRSG